jgi:hypothetical protein
MYRPNGDSIKIIRILLIDNCNTARRAVHPGGCIEIIVPVSLRQGVPPAVIHGYVVYMISNHFIFSSHLTLGPRYYNG